MKKTWIIRKDSEAVSPVIATILMVAITVVLAAVLYVMVLGFGGTSSQTPVASYQKNTITYGQRIGIVSIAESDVPWDDVTIQVSDASGNIIGFTPTKAQLMSTTALNFSATQALGSITVRCVVTDVSGNGFVSGSDYFTIKYEGATAFSSSVQYTAVLLYEPSGERCGQPIAFTG